MKKKHSAIIRKREAEVADRLSPSWNGEDPAQLEGDLAVGIVARPCERGIQRLFCGRPALLA